VFFVEEVDMNSSIWWIAVVHQRTGVRRGRFVEFEGPFPLRHEMSAIEDGDAIANGHLRIVEMKCITAPRPRS